MQLLKEVLSNNNNHIITKHTVKKTVKWYFVNAVHTYTIQSKEKCTPSCYD